MEKKSVEKTIYLNMTENKVYNQIDGLYKKWNDNSLFLDQEVEVHEKITRILNNKSVILSGVKYALIVKFCYEHNLQVGDTVHIKGKIKKPFVTTIVIEVEKH